jgi:hypothetical protein
VLYPDRCGQFVARTMELGMVFTQFVHQVGEGIGDCIELALGGVLCARLGGSAVAPPEGT